MSSLVTPTYPYSSGTTSTKNKGSLVQPYSSSSVQNPYGPNVSNRVSFQFWRQPVYQRSDGTYWTPGIDGPTYALSPWDRLYVGIPTSGQPFTPGICKIVAIRRRDKDIKKGAGADGGRVTFHGVAPAEVDIELRIWTPEQLRQLALLWPTLFPQAYKGTPPAFSVQHPNLVSGLQAINSLQFYELQGPDIDSQGVGRFMIKAIEYLKPGTTNATATATAALPTLYDQGAAPSVPTPGSQAANLAP